MSFLLIVRHSLLIPPFTTQHKHPQGDMKKEANRKQRSHPVPQKTALIRNRDSNFEMFPRTFICSDMLGTQPLSSGLMQKAC